MRARQAAHIHKYNNPCLDLAFMVCMCFFTTSSRSTSILYILPFLTFTLANPVLNLKRVLPGLMGDL
jgi:hypothetical protein